MNVTLQTSPQPQHVMVSLVDADVHPVPQSSDELRDYMPEPWRSRPNQIMGHPKLYQPWAGTGRADATPPGQGPRGSDPSFLEKQLFDEAGVDYAMLLPVVRPYRNPEVEVAFDEATNAWLADTWLSKYNKHGRYRGCINVCADQPERAVDEIEKWAGHPYFAQVRVNCYSQALLGDDRYLPIYRTAARHGLTVAMHFTKGASIDLITPVGFYRSYFELHSLWPLKYAAHLTSLICSGVFEKVPELKFVFVEGGFGWLLPLLWRLDKAWSHLRAEVPEVKRRPSEYIGRNVRFTTQPIEEPQRLTDLGRLYELVGADKLLMFSTDYPHWDYDSPQQVVFRRLSQAMREQIFFRTALDLYGLPAKRLA